MVARLVSRFIALLASLTLAATAQAGGPASAERIVAVGDLHGDWQAWTAIAEAAGLVDRKGRWAGGRTILVQLGDIADRGPDSLKIIRHLRELQRSAARDGGQVIVLIGNHEAMNVIGDLRYVHPGEYAAFVDRRSNQRRDSFFKENRDRIAQLYRQKTPDISDEDIRAAYEKSTPLGMIEHQSAWRPDGEIGRWVLSNPAVVRIGDTMFVHGGLSIELGTVPPAELNDRVAAALKAREQGPQSIINSPLGPLWYRGNISRGGNFARELALAAGTAEAGAQQAERPAIAEELAAVLAAQGVKRLVVGHTPSLSGIEQSQDGRLYRVDTGISRSYGGTLTFLEILGDRLVPHRVERPAAQ